MGKLKRTSIDKLFAENFLDKLFIYFEKEYEEIEATDVGYWRLEITASDNSIHVYFGDLLPTEGTPLHEFSSLLRTALPDLNLWIFSDSCE